MLVEVLIVTLTAEGSGLCPLRLREVKSHKRMITITEKINVIIWVHSFKAK